MPVTLAQMQAAAADRRAAAERRRDSATVHARSLLDSVRAQGRDYLTADETTRADHLMGERDSAARELRAVDAELAELDAAFADDRAYAAAQAQQIPTRAAHQLAANRAAMSNRVQVLRNERTYHAGNDPVGRGFMLDVARQFLNRDPVAADRLVRHMAEERAERPQYLERAAGDVNTGNFAGLVVPAYLVDMFAPATAALRPLADNAAPHELPAIGMTVNISRVTTPAAAGLQASELGAVTTQTIDDTLLTENVQTAAGSLNLSRQLLERGALSEDVTAGDLMRRVATALDSTIINQATSGLLAAGQAITYTDAAPTVAAFWPFIFQAQSKLEQAVLGVGIPNAVIMHPRRWNWMCAAVGSTWPLLGAPQTPQQQVDEQQSGIIITNQYGPSIRGQLSNGLRVIVDANIPTNLGVGTNQDPVIVAAMDEIHLWEDPRAPVMIRAEQPNAAALGVLLVCYEYFAYTCRRYTNNPSVINGSGLVAPAGF